MSDLSFGHSLFDIGYSNASTRVIFLLRAKASPKFSHFLRATPWNAGSSNVVPCFPTNSGADLESLLLGSWNMKIRKVWRRVALAILGLTFLMQAIESRGEAVVYEDGYAKGIKNLDVLGGCFDVRFHEGSYLSVYGREAPMFLGDEATANSAANAIKDVLNGQRRIPEINESDTEVLWIPTERINRSRFEAEQVGHNTSADPWRRYLDFEGIVNHDWEAYDFAVFEEGPQVIYADNTGHAVGIHNVRLDGECVDVRFARGSYDDVYGADAPRYLWDEPRANYAANKIMDVLNDEPAVPEINRSNNEVLWVPTWRGRTQFEAEQVGHNQSNQPWRRFGDFRGAKNNDYLAWDFAVFGETLDCNGDGEVDVNDMNCSCGPGLGSDILDAIDSYRGDLNGNGHVGFGDFLALSNNMGQAGQYTDGDLNCDGTVDFGDFLIMSDNYGKGNVKIPTLITKTLVQAVPEPNVGWLGMLFLPFAVLLNRKRRS